LTFQNHTDCPLTDFGGKTSIFSHPVYLFLRKFSLQDSRGGSKRVFLVILFTSFSGSLVSRIPGAVQRDSVGLFRAVGNQFRGKIVAEGYAENSNWTLDRSTDP
ncbi:hypothetical protein MXE49_24705, partial [Escherichia coli]|nr:hypothetical protein [Escherichia coli]